MSAGRAETDRRAAMNLLVSFDQKLRNLKRETPNEVRSGSPEFVNEEGKP
jgi:hypothetical protein